MVLFGGKVITVDEAFSIHRALAIKDGKIIAVGGDEVARRYEAPVRIDLKGRALMPGFMDNHLHPGSTSPRSIDLRKATSIAEIQRLVRAKAAQLGPGEWIIGLRMGGAEPCRATQRRASGPGRGRSRQSGGALARGRPQHRRQHACPESRGHHSGYGRSFARCHRARRQGRAEWDHSRAYRSLREAHSEGQPGGAASRLCSRSQGADRSSA